MANNNVISTNNYDVAILVHTKNEHIISGMIRGGYAADNEPSVIPDGNGSKFIAQAKMICDKINFGVNNAKIVAGNKLLIIGDNNLCAKTRTILKYAKDTDVETLVEGFTATLKSKNLEVRPEYKQALMEYTANIVGLLNKGVQISAHDIYNYPVDRIIMTAKSENSKLPANIKIGDVVEVKNGHFTSKRLDNAYSIPLDRIGGTFKLGGYEGNYHLELNFLSERRDSIKKCFNKMASKMPARQATEAASLADI